MPSPLPRRDRGRDRFAPRMSAASQKTLGIMSLIALFGMPFVLAYTGIIYWVFRGKVQLGKFSY